MTTDAHSPLLAFRRATPLQASARPAGRTTPEAALSRRYLALLRLSDAVTIALALGLTLLLRESGRMPAPPVELVFCPLIALAWYLALGASGSRSLRRLGVGPGEYKDVASASIVVFGLLGILNIVVGAHLGRAYALALPVGLLGLFLTRRAWRNRLAARGHDRRFLRRAIIVGHHDDVRYVLRQIRESAGAAYHVVGVVVDEPGERFIVDGDEAVPVVAGLDDTARAAAALGADVVIVASQSHDDGGFVRSLGWSLEGCGADLVLAAPLVDVAGPRVRFTPVQGLPLIHVDIPRFEGGKHVLKRFVDLLGASVALILLAPVFLAIAIAIKLDDGGPVLFRQTRVGRDGEVFRMVKFRSMVTDAEARLAALRKECDDGNGVLFKLRDDPRITRVGHFLRAHSLDEFPQFWNVLLGEMSLVGPRPPLPTEVATYENHVYRRLYIKPGLTGLWQINGRSELSWEQSVRLDLYYVENWSLSGDLMILWRTLRVLIAPVGAF
ncbi:MAG: sugar transferase [Microbacteriaceae bacterium]|nr:sugar transferase [Microbacteriaceae bacterium]MCL2793671.1 sugar transferase [Microbacteriaceae bacterium]